MEENNGMEKITSATPDNASLPEKTVEQQTSAENPFAFEKECIAKLEEYLQEQFPKTYEKLSLKNYITGLHKAKIKLNEHERIEEALLGYESSDNMDPFEFKIVGDDGKEQSHTAYKRKSFYGENNEKYFINIYIDLTGEYLRHDYVEYGSEPPSKQSIGMSPPFHIHNKHRAHELFLLTTFLGNENGAIVPEKIIEQCKEVLKDKKILSLGDDTGSLSEVLKHFGAECTGIEYGQKKVALANAGVFSEDGKPNMSVRQGDIWDLITDDTELMKKLGGKKFDAVISVSLFNAGSGGERPQKPLRDKYEIHDWFYYFILQTQRLLTEKGVQIHLDADTIDYRLDIALGHKKEIIDGKMELSVLSTGADHMNQLMRDLFLSNKLELDPGGHNNVIVKK